VGKGRAGERMCGTTLCAGCGLEEGRVHAAMDLVLTDRLEMKVVRCRFWLCDDCRDALLEKAKRGDGQAERMAWSLTHG